MVELHISDLMAFCLQRMLVDEIDNQESWIKEDEEFGFPNVVEMRKEVIKDCEKTIQQLVEKGFAKHIKCN